MLGNVIDRRQPLIDLRDLPDHLLRQIILDNVTLPAHLRSFLPYALLSLLIDRNLLNYYHEMRDLQLQVEANSGRLRNEQEHRQVWQVIPKKIKEEPATLSCSTDVQVPSSSAIPNSPKMYDRMDEQYVFRDTPDNFSFFATPTRSRSDTRLDSYDEFLTQEQDEEEYVEDVMQQDEQQAPLQLEEVVDQPIEPQQHREVMNATSSDDSPIKLPSHRVSRRLISFERMEPSTSRGLRPRQNASIVSKKNKSRPKSASRILTRENLQEGLRRGFREMVSKPSHNDYKYPCRIIYCMGRFRQMEKRDAHEATEHAVGRCFICSCGAVAEGIVR